MEADKKVRRRRKKTEMPFAEALEFARKELAFAQKALAQAQKTVASMSEKIPSLESTIQALECQLDPSKIRHQKRNEILQDLITSALKVEPYLSEEDLLPDPDGKELLPDAVTVPDVE